MTDLLVSKALKLPLDAVTTTSAIFGIRGSGKTSTAVVVAEELLDNGCQLVILDPVDVWHGLRSSASGDRAGYPIVVLGGRHADLPLAAGDGPVLADFVVDDGASVILSLRHFESNADRRRFITDFARRLYFRKGQSDAPAPVMVIIDEASLVVPQRVMGEDARMVGAIQQLVRQGRSSGIGVTLIDQRPATVNKDVLAMVEMLVVHRVTSPQDRKALLAWIEQHDVKGQAPAFLDSLAQLVQGEAWFWSPGWLDVFQKVRVRERRTFDSSRTPKAGESVQAPTKSAELDLVALQSKLSATIEKARADNPVELRKQIQQLRRDLERSHKISPAPDPAAIQRGVNAAVALATDKIRQRLVPLVKMLNLQASAVADVEGELLEIIQQVETNTASATGAPPAVRASRAAAVRADSPAAAAALVRLPRAIAAPRAIAPASQNGVGKTTRRIIDAIAFYESAGEFEPTREMVAAFAGTTVGGSFSARLSEARTAGYIVDSDRGGRVALTGVGRAIADPSRLPKTRAELHEVWLRKKTGKAREILEALISVYPDSMGREALAAHVGAVIGGSFSARLSEARAGGLVLDVAGGEVRASELLFPEGLS